MGSSDRIIINFTGRRRWLNPLMILWLIRTHWSMTRYPEKSTGNCLVAPPEGAVRLDFISHKAVSEAVVLTMGSAPQKFLYDLSKKVTPLGLIWVYIDSKKLNVLQSRKKFCVLLVFCSKCCPICVNILVALDEKKFEKRWPKWIKILLIAQCRHEEMHLYILHWCVDCIDLWSLSDRWSFTSKLAVWLDFRRRNWIPLVARLPMIQTHHFCLKSSFGFEKCSNM